MAVILTWNPSSWRFPREEYDSLVAAGNRLADYDAPDDRWSVGVRRHGIAPGDRAFLLRQGGDRRGLVAAGWVASEIYFADHWDVSRAEAAAFVDVKWSCFVSIDNRVPTEELLDRVPGVKWNSIYGSGHDLDDSEYIELEKIWAESTDDWCIRPGQHLSRDMRTRIYGGGKYGGIEPSARTANVFVYSDPEAGHKSGYIYDGWSADRSVYLYTGEGPTGDQQLTGGNLGLLEHGVQGRCVRFVADGVEAGSTAKRQLYVGAFALDQKLPFVREDGPDADGNRRQVIVFRLRPLGESLVRDVDESKTGEASSDGEAALVPLEAITSLHHAVGGSAAGVATKREFALSTEYEAHLSAQGIEVKRWRLRPPSGLSFLYTDIYDVVNHELYEAKSSADRNRVRLAIGQLLDYRRLMPDPESLKLSVLLPSRPSDDLCAYLNSLGIGCVFKDSATHAFVRM